MSLPITFYCDMTALSTEQRARHHELAALLQSSLAAVQELADGYEFEFPWESATYAALAQITPLEHACCPFFDIAIRIESESSKLCWRLTGRGIKPFIRAEFGKWFSSEGTGCLSEIAGSSSTRPMGCCADGSLKSWLQAKPKGFYIVATKGNIKLEYGAQMVVRVASPAK